jgi:hypothetical protein
MHSLEAYDEQKELEKLLKELEEKMKNEGIPTRDLESLTNKTISKMVVSRHRRTSWIGERYRQIWADARDISRAPLRRKR